MTRQPTGPAADADDGDPPSRPRPKQRSAHPVDDPADCAGIVDRDGVDGFPCAASATHWAEIR